MCKKLRLFVGFVCRLVAASKPRALGMVNIDVLQGRGNPMWLPWYAFELVPESRSLGLQQGAFLLSVRANYYHSRIYPRY